MQVVQGVVGVRCKLHRQRTDPPQERCLWFVSEFFLFVIVIDHGALEQSVTRRGSRGSIGRAVPQDRATRVRRIGDKISRSNSEAY